MSGAVDALLQIDHAIAAGQSHVLPNELGIAGLIEAHAAFAELIGADKEYDQARRQWDHVTAHDPEETSDETWQRVADRFEAAVARRAAALARIGGAA